jgi:hypothetical protein
MYYNKMHLDQGIIQEITKYLSGSDLLSCRLVWKFKCGKLHNLIELAQFVISNGFIKNKFTKYFAYRYEFAMSSPEYAYYYVRDNDVYPPEILAIISTSAEYSYNWASYTSERFVEGELAIANSSQYAYKYACDVLRCPWELSGADRYIIDIAHNSLLQDSDYTIGYVDDVIHGRWLAFEEKISKNTYTSYLYATYVMNCRWPTGSDIDEKLMFGYSKYYKLPLYKELDD